MSARKLDPQLQSMPMPEEVGGWEFECNPQAKEHMSRSLVLDLLLITVFTGFWLLRASGL